MTDSLVLQVIRRCGGAKALATALDGVSADAVYKWVKIGIPDRHWPVVMRLSGATADDLVQANALARSPKAVEFSGGEAATS